MAYTNPLHPPVHPTAHSQFSTISGALQPQYLSATRQHIPQQPYYSSKPGSGRVHAPIAFDHPGYAKQGVQMRELTMRSIGALASVIQNAGDAVLAHTGLSRITLRIMWPGYEHLDFASTIELNIGGYGPITRAQLGAVISQNFARFIDVRPLSPSIQTK
ncbi:hypothetical protein H0H87_009875 [Tephrocybe sp. NHM501043]|nr:hypothetical protein H0H87_009875 [Tephrocybe sp. NHM501043]